MKKIDSNPAAINGSDHSSYESANLDLLRSIAVLLVFGTHYIDIQYGLGAEWSLLWHLGQLGVLIFFVHTSLVLMWSLERSSLHRECLFAPFYVRRAFRIYPLSIVCVLFAYWFDARWASVHLWQNLTLTQYVFLHDPPGTPPSVTPLWSLPLEIEMYVALPILFLAFRRRSLKLLAAAWCTSVAMACVQPCLGEGFAILRYAPCFLGGVVAWRLMRERDRRWLPAWSWPFMIAAVSLIWMASIKEYHSVFISVFGLCLGFAIPLFKEIRWDLLRASAKIIARYSYGIYLSHFPIMVYVMQGQNRDHPWFKIIPPMIMIRHYARPINMCLVTVVTSVLSLALYHGIEEPGIRLGRMIAQRLAQRSKQWRPQPATR